MPQQQADCRNLLLRRMEPADFALLSPDLEPLRLKRGTVLFECGAPVPHAIFPADGVFSLVAESPEGQRVEAGLVGREGFTPTVMALGDAYSPYFGNVQLSAEGHRIAAAALWRALDESRTLRAFLMRFGYALSVQTSFTALSNAVHSIEERLARWILMCDDRVDTGELGMTHEFMSLMLAVRRPSVTTALHVLEGNGFIRAERGLVVVRNRAALEEFAGDAYGTPEREYERLLGSWR